MFIKRINLTVRTMIRITKQQHIVFNLSLLLCTESIYVIIYPDISRILELEIQQHAKQRKIRDGLLDMYNDRKGKRD